MHSQDDCSCLNRRDLMLGGSAMLATLALGSQAFTADTRSSPMSVMDTLTQRNAQFAQGQFQPELKIIPSLHTLIIGCVDPRVDPKEIFALNPGEAAIIRNVGGRVFPSTLETVDMLSEVARSAGGALAKGWNLVVLHHTDCGINRLVKSPDRLANHFGVAPAELPGKAVTDPYASVAIDIAALRADPRISGELMVSGLVYDVATGRTKTVVPPTLLRTANPA